jgi:hypothetical protein
MAIVDRRIDTEKDLTIYKVNGELSNEELLRLNNELFIGQSTEKIIFDFRNGSLKNISTGVFKQKIISSKSRAEKRKEIKVAIIAKKDIDFGMGRMYAAYVEMEDIGVTISVFRTQSEALQWLDLES